MSASIELFTARFYAEWLPRYCQHDELRKPEGFRPESLERLTEHDAYWFLRALRDGVVAEQDGFFRAARSGANEQIVWTGLRSIVPQPISLWISPIISIAAAGRLFGEFGWDPDQIGLQPDKWAFDFLGYEADGVGIAGEARATPEDLERLVTLISAFGAELPLHAEPPEAEAARRNAYKKVLAIRTHRPRLLWALAPGGGGEVFRIEWSEAGGVLFDLVPTADTSLRAPLG